MHDSFHTIDLLALAAVVGGQDESQPSGNSESVSVGTGLPGTPPILEKDGKRTDYGLCMEFADKKKLSVDDTLKLCGMPK